MSSLFAHGWGRVLGRLAVAVLAICWWAPAHAVSAGKSGQGTAASATDSRSAPTEVAADGSGAGSMLGTDTPRRAVERFLAAARAGQLEQAAATLYTTRTSTNEMNELARKLQAVLDRRVPLDRAQLDKLSDQPGGHTGDGSADEDEVGRIDMPLGSEPVRVQRQQRPDGQAVWLFSPETVAHIDAWYERLDDRWVLDHLPNFLLVTGPGGLLLWQWLTLPLLLLLAALCGWLGSWAVHLGLRVFWRGDLARAALSGQRSPLHVLWTSLLLRGLSGLLFLTTSAEQSLHAVTNVAVILAILLAFWRAATAVLAQTQRTDWWKTRPALLSVLPILQRLLEISLWVLAVLWSLAELGYSPTGVLASLGLGGLAIALAAKNTLEHLLGGVALSLDQPLRLGDAVKIGDVHGVVEAIGLRSTRIRTADRSLVTIPNGKLADMQIETLAARDRIRVQFSLHVSYTLRAPALRALRDAMHQHLLQQPLVYRDQLRVYLIALSDTAATIEVTCWIETVDQDQFLEARQSLLLSLLDLVESHGALAALRPPGK